MIDFTKKFTIKTFDFHRRDTNLFPYVFAYNVNKKTVQFNRQLMLNHVSRFVSSNISFDFKAKQYLENGFDMIVYVNGATDKNKNVNYQIIEKATTTEEILSLHFEDLETLLLYFKLKVVYL